MAGEERESCDYYLSPLGLPFGASEGYHTFLQSPPPHSTSGSSKGVVRKPHSACRASPGCQAGQEVAFWRAGHPAPRRPFCGRPQEGRIAGTQGTEDPGPGRKKGRLCVCVPGGAGAAGGLWFCRGSTHFSPPTPPCAAKLGQTRRPETPAPAGLGPRLCGRGASELPGERRGGPIRAARSCCSSRCAPRRLPRPVVAFPALTPATPPRVRELSPGELGAPGPSGPRRGQSRPALTSEVFFFLPLPQSHLSAVTGRRKEK